MKIFSAIFFFISINTIVFSQQKLEAKDSLAIIDILNKQEKDWNRGDIDEFMKGYLKSDKLVFSGSSGPIYGWKATLDRYKKTYSDKEKMGKLKFEILNVIALSPKVIQLQGKFNLTRSIGDAFGYFTLNWIKVKNRWYIISDHTSGSN
ncbi:DUF4440 domain-containing protein [Bacteroidetes bacterium SCGC AAA795-G10]|nr:DUF4440 domain-containing protein [Bacteroidetes bacterium SCGC AAA795-G10]